MCLMSSGLWMHVQLIIALYTKTTHLDDYDYDYDNDLDAIQHNYVSVID